MDIAKIITELRAECDLLEDTIAKLQHLAVSRGRKAGRPPGWLVNGHHPKPPKPRKDGYSAKSAPPGAA